MRRLLKESISSSLAPPPRRGSAAGNRSAFGRLPPWAAIALSLGACGTAGSVAHRPESTIVAYEQAIRSRDAEALHALLDEETRASVTPEELARLITENGEELDAQAGAWSSAAKRGVAATARFPTRGGEEVLVLLEKEGWRVDGNVLETSSTLTPRDAVLALRRALARRNMTSALAALSRESRTALEAQIQLFIEETGDPLDFDIEIRGNLAWVRTAGGLVVALVREAGEWKVRELGHPADPGGEDQP